MQLRKLEGSQHGLTRGLWEKVFPEDNKAFLDYYYFLKTRDNQIYVIEEDHSIRSMLQLNPYLLQIGKTQHSCNYIIAVATEAAYRKRGYMGRLLKKSMQDMYALKEPFTFLMPAAEAIYTPYDFRFIYAQNQCKEFGKEGRIKCEVQDAELWDAASIAEFFQDNFEGRYDVHTVRDDNYYQTLIFEQKSMGGGIKLLKQNGSLVGCFAYAREGDTLEIREPLYLPEFETDFQKYVYQLRMGHKQPAKIFAGVESEGQEKVPMIMVRILHFETLLSSMNVKKGQIMDCSFAVLDFFLTQNSKVWRLRGGEESQHIQISETEDSEGVLTMGALTSLLFGYKSIEAIRQEENVVIPETLGVELDKIQPMENVFLNEIV